ncbi:hypothetical protein AA313_de0204099 [Arthrobotrys entomopaga]|nr:hypothetical protein AA313_de0204099 [Arthrobotrys entomopaga]
MVSTRSSKEVSPALPSQESDTHAESPSSSSQTRSPNPSSNRKRRRSGRKSGSQSPPSGGDSPKSDTSTREKMRKTKIEESGETTASQNAVSEGHQVEMVDAQIGEVSPGGKGKKRTHDEIGSNSKDPKPATNESEIRPPSRAANGEPVGKKLRETPSPPREDTEDICMFENVPQDILDRAAELESWLEYIDAKGPKRALDTSGPRASFPPLSPITAAVDPYSAQSSVDQTLDDDFNNHESNDNISTQDTVSVGATEIDNLEEFSEDDTLNAILDSDRDHTDTADEPENNERSTDIEEAVSVTKEPKPESTEEFKEQSDDATKSKPTSGFSNTSSVSPFGSLATKSTETAEVDKHTGQSAFASSKFSSFANVTSAFGVTTTSLAPSPFAGPPTGSENVFSKLSGAISQSTFPAPPIGSANVFAKMSGNTSTPSFGAASSPFGSAASPFGSGGSIFGNTLSSKPLPKVQPLEGIRGSTKPDTSDTKESENGEDDAEVPVNNNSENTKVNPISKAAIKSGEEDYDMNFQARAKLFELSGGAWKERGIGNIRVLTPKEDFDSDYDEPKKPLVGRIVMRQEGVGRLILNANIFKDMLVAEKTHSDNTIRFLAVNSVSFNDGRDETGDDSTDKSENQTKVNDNAKETLPEDTAAASKTLPVLGTYLLRFKGSELVHSFRDNIEASFTV